MRAVARWIKLVRNARVRAALCFAPWAALAAALAVVRVDRCTVARGRGRALSITLVTMYKLQMVQ